MRGNDQMAPKVDAITKNTKNTNICGEFIPVLNVDESDLFSGKGNEGTRRRM